MNSYDKGKLIPDIDPEINSAESAYLDNLLQPFPELKRKHDFFGQSSRAQKLRYICSFILRDIMTLRTDKISAPDNAPEREMLIDDITANMGVLEKLGVSSLTLNTNLNPNDPLEIAKNIAGQILSLRHKPAIGEPIDINIANQASYLLGLPFTKEYAGLAKKGHNN